MRDRRTYRMVLRRYVYVALHRVAVGLRSYVVKESSMARIAALYLVYSYSTYVPSVRRICTVHHQLTQMRSSLVSFELQVGPIRGINTIIIQMSILFFGSDHELCILPLSNQNTQKKMSQLPARSLLFFPFIFLLCVYHVVV